MNDTVGIFYELPDGRIVNTFGFDNVNKTVSYYFDDGKGSLLVSFEEFHTWKPRKDLYDFPNASDPKLPYVFDLWWDIKYMSALKRELEGHVDEKEIKELMLEHNIKF